MYYNDKQCEQASSLRQILQMVQNSFYIPFGASYVCYCLVRIVQLDKINVCEISIEKNQKMKIDLENSSVLVYILSIGFLNHFIIQKFFQIPKKLIMMLK